MFGLNSDDSRRAAEDEFAPDTLSFRIRTSVSKMVWGCMCIFGLDELHIAERNVNNQKYMYIDVLESSLLPSINSMFGGRNHPFVFQDD